MATDFIGGLNDFDCGIEPPELMCDRNDLRELVAFGIAVQSHGMSHRSFSDLSGATVEREMTESRKVLEKALQEPVQLLSFPFGDAGRDPALARAMLVRSGYRGACLYGEDRLNVLPGADPFLLARFAIGCGHRSRHSSAGVAPRSLESR
jgi:hypothetical protein